MKLPETRQGLTKKVTACGMKFYVTVNFFDSNEPAEIFVVIAKNGSVIAGLIDCWCISTSTCLRTNKWDDLREKFLHQRFDPSDDTNSSLIHAITVTVDELIKARKEAFSG